MNKKQTIAFAMVAMVFGVMTSPIISAQDAEARIFPSKYVLHGELTAPSGDKPFGGEPVGTYHIQTRGGFTGINVNLEYRASEGMVYEGWLVDVQTGEKLSTGTLKEGTQRGYFGGLAPEFHYDVFVVTEEPRIDSDPKPNTPVAGVPLSDPFGQ